MSGNFRTFKLATGGYADVPEDEIDSWMGEMESMGVDFETANVEADMQVGEPETIRSAPEPMMPEAPRGALSSLLETGGDALRGLNSGLYWRGSDEVGAAGRASPMGDMAGNYGGALEAERGANELARNRSPMAYTAAETAGFVPGMFMGGARAAAGGMRALAPIAEGMISGALGSDSNDAQQTASDSLDGGLLSGVSALAPQLASLLGRGVRGAGQWLGQAGNEVRNAAFGGTAGDFQKLARTEGLDYVEGGPGAAAERLGLTNRIIPQSPSAYAKRSGKAMGAAGQAKSAALEEADQALGTHVPTEDLAGALEQRGRGAAMDATVEGGSEAGRMGELASLLRDKRGPMMPPSELDLQKQAYYRRGYQNDAISDSTAGVGREANRMAGAEARGMLDTALEAAPEGVQGRVRQANQDYGELATINNMSRNRAAGNQAAPSGEGFFGTLMRPATQTLKNYGPDAAANALTLGRDAAGGMGRGMQELGEAGAQTMQQRGAGAAVGGAANPPPDLAQIAIGDLEATQGQALGTYRGRFAEAMIDPSPGAVSALITRLTQTDPQFRQQVLPQLRRMAGIGD